MGRIGTSTVVGWWCAVLLVLASPGAAVAQDADGVVSGFVRSGDSGQAVEGAQVELVERGLRVLTAADGGFTLAGVPYGAYTLRVDRIGFEPHLEVVTLDGPALTVTVSLATAVVELGEIVVAPGRFGVMGDRTVRQQQTLTREDLETVPQVGEDVFRVLRTLPGVATDDISTRLNIRGGSDAELLSLLDGVELYEPYHLKDFDGIFGIVDVQSIGGIELVTGGFGPEYGDKLTGVFGMTSRRAPVQGTRTALSLSVSNASVLTRGSFDEGQGEFLFQARRGYLDLLLALTSNSDDDEELSPSYYDLFGRVDYRLGAGHRLAFNVLHAGDDLTFSDPDGRVNSGWDSSYGWVTWDADFGGLSLSTQAFAGEVDRRRDGDIDDPDALRGPNLLTVADRRSFRFGGVKHEARIGLGEHLLLKAGGEAKRQEADYDYASDTRRIASSALGPDRQCVRHGAGGAGARGARAVGLPRCAGPALGAAHGGGRRAVRPDLAHR